MEATAVRTWNGPHTEGTQVLAKVVSEDDPHFERGDEIQTLWTWLVPFG